MTGLAAPPAPAASRQAVGVQPPDQPGLAVGPPPSNCRQGCDGHGYRGHAAAGSGRPWQYGARRCLPGRCHHRVSGVVRRRHQVMRFPYIFPVGLSVLAGALASTVAYARAYNSVGGGLVSLVQDGFVLAWGIAIANLGRDAELLRTITRAWVISATVWAALMIIGVSGHLSVLSGETARDGVRAAFTLGDPNLAANYFICSLLVLRAIQYPSRRLVRWSCCALIVAAIGLTGSNGGALVLVAATVLGAIFRMARRRGAVPALIAAGTLIVACVAIGPQVNVSSIVQKAQSKLAIAQRLDRSAGREQRVSQHHPGRDGAAVPDRRYAARPRARRHQERVPGSPGPLRQDGT